MRQQQIELIQARWLVDRLHDSIQHAGLAPFEPLILHQVQRNLRILSQPLNHGWEDVAQLPAFLVRRAFAVGVVEALLRQRDQRFIVHGSTISRPSSPVPRHVRIGTQANQALAHRLPVPILGELAIGLGRPRELADEAAAIDLLQNQAAEWTELGGLVIIVVICIERPILRMPRDGVSMTRAIEPRDRQCMDGGTHRLAIHHGPEAAQKRREDIPKLVEILARRLAACGPVKPVLRKVDKLPIRHGLLRIVE